MTTATTTGFEQLALLEQEGFLTLDPPALNLTEGTSYDSWSRLGLVVGRFRALSSWMLGDWQVYGIGAFGEEAEQAFAESRLSKGTLDNYRRLALAFPAERRRASLTPSHHEEVRGLPEDEQDAWLDRAEAEGLSRADLRAAMDKAGVKTKRGGDPLPAFGSGVPKRYEELERIDRLIVSSASDTGDGTFLVNAEPIVQLKAWFGEE